MVPVIQVTDKPVIVVLMGDRLIQEGVELLRAVRIPEYRFPEAAASALGALSRRAEYLERVDETLMLTPGCDASRAHQLLAGQPAGQFTNQEVATGLLEAYGIQALKLILATSPEEAAAAALQVGFPVVLKVASPDISHKSDVGGVLLNLKDIESVKAGYDIILKNAHAAQPDARIEGEHVQQLLPPGQDVIVGVVCDPQFGPMVMFGSGGVEVEGLKDVAFELAPLTRREAEGMLESTWAGRKLRGFRSLPPADREAALAALARLAQLALDCSELGEIEINPLRVLPEGQGAFAIDVRAKIV
jgi:acetyltransferase